MAKTLRKLKRPLGNSSYKKRFVIAAEGKKTELAYFTIFNRIETLWVHVDCLKGDKKSAPRHVLERMKKNLQQKPLKPKNEAWLVIDKDNWTNEQIDQCFKWSLQRNNYHFALSNPKFEYWLLLHYEEETDITSGSHCTERLKNCMPDYNKGVDNQGITIEKIRLAIERAKKRDHPPCKTWPQDSGQTTIYRLIENILQQEVKT